MKYDFGGYATKNDLVCSDGRIIRRNAFKHQDGLRVPLVWKHQHDSPDDILGHSILENREDGVYCYNVFNDSTTGKNAKELVKHGDITQLSIWANQLKQNANEVIHGAIKEVSLVLGGANPGAVIDNLNFAHGDGSMTVDDSEAIVYMPMEFDVTDGGEFMHADTNEKTFKEIFDEFTEEQKEVVYAIASTIADDITAEEQAAHEDDNSDKAAHEDDNSDNLAHENQGGSDMRTNIIDKAKEAQQAIGVVVASNELSHDDMNAVFDEAKRSGTGTLGEVLETLKHDGTYGIDNIDYLFPDAQKLMDSPDFISRRMEWVNDVITQCHKSPFSRIKTVQADITADEARAKGYVKGAEKVEEVIKLLKRVTTPATIYKKQKLDRDDIVDIVDFNVVVWLKAEMRVMLDAEVAQAILFGDLRDQVAPDKVNEDCIRPIYTDADLYAPKVQLAGSLDTMAIIESIIRARKLYKGSGSPALYTTTDFVTDMILLKDTTHRRIYKSVKEIAEDLRVAKIVEVEAMEGVSREDDSKAYKLLGIIVNLKDYNIGADKGGKIGMFDDFDIDFNQQKYLIETRMSGALTKPFSALIVEQEVAAG